MGEAKRRRDKQNPIVPPEELQTIKGAALTMVVSFGTATLRGGFPAEQVTKIVKIDPNLSEEERSLSKNYVVCGLRANKHIDDKMEAAMMLLAAVSLAFSSEMGNVLRLMDLSGATLTYEITPLPTSNDYNWQLDVTGVPIH